MDDLGVPLFQETSISTNYGNPVILCSLLVASNYVAGFSVSTKGMTWSTCVQIYIDYGGFLK
jgi:hypothetical protein